MNAEKTVSTYCPECDHEVEASLERRVEVLPVKGEPTSYDAVVAICSCCGGVIGDSRIEDGNLRRAYSAYCTAHGLMSPDEVRALRNRYGLSLREFSRLLGFGEQTIARYEAGAIPDDSHNTMLMLASSPSGAMALLSVRGPLLSEKATAAVRQFIEGAAPRIEAEAATAEREWPSAAMMTPSRYNGFRPFSLERVSAVVFELAARCKDLYKTKLHKAMFFTDFLNYARSTRSMTGLAYAHAPYGPVMDGRDAIVSELQDAYVVDLAEKGWGEVVVPKRHPEKVLNDDEILLIDEVAAFVDTFETASEISSFSHRLSVWRDTDDGCLIEYDSGAAQVEDAIARRMASRH